MKIILMAFLLSLSAQAIELKFIGPCDENFIMKVAVEEDYRNVGELTIETLKKFNIPFQGTERGLASAFETPTGSDALEVISEEELRAYGWCFSVDGVAPEVYPHEVLLTAETKSVVWHFGFARYYQGKWVTQCTPASTVRPDFLCKDKTAE
jgi:hypothetical protein